jgi:hypothetical protein
LLSLAALKANPDSDTAARLGKTCKKPAPASANTAHSTSTVHTGQPACTSSGPINGPTSPRRPVKVEFSAVVSGTRSGPARSIREYSDARSEPAFTRPEAAKAGSSIQAWLATA